MPAVIVAACVVSLATFRNWQLRRAQQELQMESARQLARTAARTLDGTIAATQTLLVSMGELLDPTVPPARNAAVLQRIFRAAPVPYANLWIADTTGGSLGTARTPPSGRPFAIADRQYFKEAVRSRKFTVGEAVSSRTVVGAPLVMTFAMPVLDTLTGAIKAVVGASIEIDSLEPVRTARTLPQGSVLTIMDSSGTIVFRSLDPEHWIGRRFQIATGSVNDFAVGEGVGSGPSSDGTFRLTGFRRAARVPWIVYIGIPLRYTLDIVNNQFIRDIVVGGLLTLIVLAVGYWSAVRVVLPIESLTADVRAITGGDMTRRSSVTANDEIGELARSFNQMADTVVERNAALNASQEQLLHVQKMDALGSFAGGIAHDFNNYLASIVAHAELADLALGENETARQDLKEVLASATRAADLTRQILVFSRKQMVELRTLDLNEVVRGIERMLQRLAGEERQLVLDLSGDAVLVHADHGQLEQVVVNLVANARDAMADGGRITLTVRAVDVAPGDPRMPMGSGGRFAQLTVSDEGTGIAGELLDRIFDPFFSTKERGRGTGMGLAIAFSIIEQSGGKLSVDSTPGVGTTFVTVLPLAAAEAEPAPAVPEALAAIRQIRQGTGRILLAEDEPAVRSSCERILMRAGYSVISAPDGFSALERMAAESEPFTLLLSDVVMPGMSGSELARRVKARQSDIAVLFMSGYADDVVVHDEIAASTVTCVAKPFTVRELCDAVERAIAARVPSVSA
ncbi:MAG: ATP-binding protein [Gemmatimonadota bacterium]